MTPQTISDLAGHYHDLYLATSERDGFVAAIVTVMTRLIDDQGLSEEQAAEVLDRITSATDEQDIDAHGWPRMDTIDMMPIEEP